MGAGYTAGPLPERVPCGRKFFDVDTTPPRIPDRLWNPVRSWCDTPPVLTTSLPLAPEPVHVDLPKPYIPPMRFRDPDPMYVRPDIATIIERHGRFDDEPTRESTIAEELMRRRDEERCLAVVAHREYMKAVLGF